MYLSTSIERKHNNSWIPITKDGEADQHVGVIQNFGHSFIKTLKISISGVEIYDSGVYYAYRAYNLLLNNSDIIFNIHRNSDEFLILAPSYKVGNETKNNPYDYRVKVHDIRVYVKTVDVNQSLNNAISSHLQNTSAKYPMRKIEIRSLFLPEGTSDLSHNVFTSVIPRRLIIGFVSTDLYTGKYAQSPSKFQHAKIRAISVEANGNIFPGAPYSLNFSDNKYIRAFVDMYTGLGMDDGERTMSINLENSLMVGVSL